MNYLKKNLLRIKFELEYRIPKPVKFWKEFLQLPFNKLLLKNQGLEESEWQGDGFLCLCCEHVRLFNREQDLDTGSTIGYYICDKKGCGKIARHELMPGLKKNLKNLDPEELL